MNPDLKQLMKRMNGYERLIDMSKRLGGFAAPCLHACSRRGDLPVQPVDEYVPLHGADDGRSYPVHHDDDRGAGTAKNGLSGTADTDGDPVRSAGN